MRLSEYIALAGVVFSLMACDSGRTDRSETATATGTTASDSAAYRDDTLQTIGTAGQTAADARHFADQAMMANTAEVKLGELAAGRAQSAAVKEFA